MNNPEIQLVVTAEKMPYKMILRDYFAAAALTGLLSNPKLLVKAKRKLTEVDRLAASANKSRRAYEYAEAMLSEREKGQS